MGRDTKTDDLKRSAMQAPCLVERIFALLVLLRRKSIDKVEFERLLHDRLWQILEIASTRVLLSILDTCADFPHHQAMTALALVKTEIIAQSAMKPLDRYDEKRVLGHGLRAISAKPDFIINLYQRIARDVRRSPLILNLLREILLRMKQSGKWSLSYFDVLTGNREAEKAMETLGPSLRQPKSQSIPQTVIERLGDGFGVLCIGCDTDKLPRAISFSGQRQLFETVVLVLDKVNPEWLEALRIFAKSRVLVVQSSGDREALESLFFHHDLIPEDFWLDDGRWCIAARKPGVEALCGHRCTLSGEKQAPESSEESRPIEDWLIAAVQNPASFSVEGRAYFLARNALGSYCVPMEYGSQSEAKKLIQGRVWEAETVQLMRREVGDGDIVHAGTSFGDMLPGLSSACSVGCLVWAFEPNSASYKAARLTVQFNQLTNIVLSRAALGGTSGWEDILVRNSAGNNIAGRSRIEANRHHPQHLVERIPVVTLDELIPRHRRVSLIHLDVEGFELEALQGAVKTLQAHRPLLVIETVPDQPWFEQVILKELGYRARKKVDGNTVFKC